MYATAHTRRGNNEKSRPEIEGAGRPMGKPPKSLPKISGHAQTPGCLGRRLGT